MLNLAAWEPLTSSSTIIIPTVLPFMWLKWLNEKKFYFYKSTLDAQYQLHLLSISLREILLRTPHFLPLLRHKSAFKPELIEWMLKTPNVGATNRFGQVLTCFTDAFPFLITWAMSTSYAKFTCPRTIWAFPDHPLVYGFESIIRAWDSARLKCSSHLWIINVCSMQDPAKCKWILAYHVDSWTKW